MRRKTVIVRCPYCEAEFDLAELVAYPVIKKEVMCFNCGRQIRRYLTTFR